MRVSVVMEDQVVVQECYLNSLAVAREPLNLVAILRLGMDDSDASSRILRTGAENKRLTPTKDLKEVWIGPLPHQVTKLGISLPELEDDDLIALLRKNIKLFTLAPSYMSGIDTRDVCHIIPIDPSVKLVS